MVEANSTERKILNSAKKLFVNNGYHDTSMSAIAEEADLGKGTLYWYFDSKDELFQAMIAREAQIILEELDELADSNKNLEEVLKEFVRIRLKRMIKHHKTSQMFLDGENYINEKFKKTMCSIYQSFVKLIESIIREGIEDGLLETDNPQKAAAGFIGIINSVCTNSVLEKGYEDFNMENNVEFIYNLFMNGLKSREGEKNIDEDKKNEE